MSIVLPKVGRPDIHTVRPKMRGSHFVENLPVSSNDKDIYSAVNEGETHSGANKVSENNTSKSPLRNVRFRVLVVTTARPSTHNSMVHPFATKGSLPDKSRRLVLPCLYCSPCERAKLCMPDVIITISFPSLHGLARSNAFIQRAHRYVPGMNLADNISRLALSRIFYAFSNRSSTICIPRMHSSA